MFGVHAFGQPYFGQGPFVTTSVKGPLYLVHAAGRRDRLSATTGAAGVRASTAHQAGSSGTQARSARAQNVRRRADGD